MTNARLFIACFLSNGHADFKPNAYLRMIENRWVTSESSFVEMAWWDACIDPQLRPVPADGRLPVGLGVDASVKGTTILHNS